MSTSARRRKSAPPPVTLRQIAERSGVCVQTVSNVLNGRNKESSPIIAERAQRIRSIAHVMGYRPNAAARSMKSGKSRHVGVMVYGKGTAPIELRSAEFLTGVNSVLEPLGYTTCMVRHCEVEGRDAGLVRVFEEQALEGMIVASPLTPEVQCRVDERMDHLIWLDAGVREPEGCLWRDEVEAGRLAGDALRQAAAPRTLYLDRSDGIERGNDHAAQRLQGFMAAVNGHLTVDYLDVRDVPRGTKHSLYARLDRLAACLKTCQAVVVSDYKVLIDLLAIAPGLGYRPGVDFALMCCDDVCQFREMFPHLCRADFDRVAMGRRAADMLLRKLNHPAKRNPSYVYRPIWRPTAQEATSLPALLSNTLSPLAAPAHRARAGS